MSDGLKHRAISGGLWSVIHKFATVFLGFISGIVLARLLTPHDYGIIGMLTIFLAISNTFIDGGFGSALIQKKNPTDIDYSTILYWNLAFSIFFYLILYVCAPYIAFFYDLPLLRDVLRVQGVVLIFNAARIVQRNQLRKQLQFKKIAIINSSSSLMLSKRSLITNSTLLNNSFFKVELSNKEFNNSLLDIIANKVSKAHSFVPLEISVEK